MIAQPTVPLRATCGAPVDARIAAVWPCNPGLATIDPPYVLFRPDSPIAMTVTGSASNRGAMARSACTSEGATGDRSQLQTAFGGIDRSALACWEQLTPWGGPKQQTANRMRASVDFIYASSLARLAAVARARDIEICHLRPAKHPLGINPHPPAVPCTGHPSIRHQST
jgi:hypothetical protein